jgi:hypothetical protein
MGTHIGLAKTAATLAENRVDYSSAGKTSVPDAGSGNTAMSGLAHDATETSRTAFGYSRSLIAF